MTIYYIGTECEWEYIPDAVQSCGWAERSAPLVKYGAALLKAHRVYTLLAAPLPPPPLYHTANK